MMAGIAVSVGGFALAGYLLSDKQALVVESTRALFMWLLPDRWFTAGSTSGAGGLRSFVVLVVAVLFLVLTAVRYRLARTEARAEERRARPPAIFWLTLVRTVLLVEAVALLFLAGDLTDPITRDEPYDFTGAAWSWPWFATRCLPWIVIGLIVMGASVNSADRATRRAVRIEYS
jgi:hypothetical protein